MRRQVLLALVICAIVALTSGVLSPAPPQASAVTATDITGGNSYTCAVSTAGDVQCRGFNANFELGDGQACGSLCTTPVDVCADATCASNLSAATAIAAGSTHTCAVTMASGVKCWGFNGNGQLGDGSFTNRSTPVDVCADATCATSLSGVVALSSGGKHTCAVVSGGGG